MVETINKLTHTQRRLVQELGREPTLEELSVEMEMDIKKVAHIQKISQDIISLEAPVGSEEDSKLGDFIEDEEAINPFEATNRQLRKKTFMRCSISSLPRERKIIEMRFGLKDGIGHTLEEGGQGIRRHARTHPSDRSQSAAEKCATIRGSLTIREHGGAPKRIGFSPVHSFSQGQSVSILQKGKPGRIGHRWRHTWRNAITARGCPVGRHVLISR